MELTGVITIDKRDVYANGQGQTTKVKVTEFKNPFTCFRTVTQTGFHWWLRNDA